MKKNGKFVLVLAIIMIALCGTAAAELPPMYAGVDLGVGMSPASVKGLETGLSWLDGDINVFMAGFEMIPKFGISPISSLPDLAFEFNLQMDFLSGKMDVRTEGTWNENGYVPGSGTGKQAIKINVISPQILAVYTFSKWAVQPYIGAGFGMNFNSLSIEGVKIDNFVKNSFSLVLKGGVYYNITEKLMLSGLIRYNLNVFASTGTVEYSANWGVISLGAGLAYRF